jgi:hypothetical protein
MTIATPSGQRSFHDTRTCLSASSTNCLNLLVDTPEGGLPARSDSRARAIFSLLLSASLMSWSATAVAWSLVSTHYSLQLLDSTSLPRLHFLHGSACLECRLFEVESQRVTDRRWPGMSRNDWCPPSAAVVRPLEFNGVGCGAVRQRAKSTPNCRSWASAFRRLRSLQAMPLHLRLTTRFSVISYRKKIIEQPPSKTTGRSFFDFTTRTSPSAPL